MSRPKITSLTSEEAAALAAGYLRYVVDLRRDDPDSIWSPETDPDNAAYDDVNRLIRHGPPAVAFLAVREILRQTSDEELDVSAAGPLEELVRCHGHALDDDLRSEAARDERFRWALGCVWIGPEHVSAALYEEFRRVAAEVRAQQRPAT